MNILSVILFVLAAAFIISLLVGFFKSKIGKAISVALMITGFTSIVVGIFFVSSPMWRDIGIMFLIAGILIELLAIILYTRTSSSTK